MKLPSWWPRRPARGGTVSVRGVNYSTSPLLASRTPPGRSRFVLVVFGLAFLGLICRAFWIQVVDDEFYLTKGQGRYGANIPLYAARGDIVDRNGITLATSVEAPAAALDAKVFYETGRRIKPLPPEKRAEMLRLLDMTEAEFQAKIEEKSGRVGDDGKPVLPRYVPLRTQLDAETADALEKLRVRGLKLEPGFRRRFPEGEALAHLVGFTAQDKEAADKGLFFERGTEGAERVFEDRLRGETGRLKVVRDGKGRIVEHQAEPIDPRLGRTVQLTIDSRIQAMAYQRLRDAVLEHRAQAGSVVVLDAQSGELLALANYPSYPPEDRRRVQMAQMRNRALADTFEPGSTVKPFVIALGLEKGVIKPDDVLDTSPFRIANLLVNDGEHGRPSMTIGQVIQKSSNVGTAKVAMRLENKDLGEMYRKLGFGVQPDFGFNAAPGRVRPWQRWKPIEKATMSYGYGLSASLLQIARAYTSLARDGELAPFSIVKGEEALPGAQIYHPETARKLREMLRGTVSREGTAARAQLVGYSAGGKTGTAKKLERGSYHSGKYRAWFAGMAPIDKPRIVVAIMVDEPTGVYYGGLVAAPVFKVVAEQALRTLSVPPDQEIKPQVVAAPPSAGAARRAH